MKVINTVLLLFFAVCLSFSVSNAQDGTKTIVDEVLIIPNTVIPPVIDGELDDVWKTVTAHPMQLFEDGGASTDTDMVYDDHSSNFRAMWDEDYFYVFVSVVDDSLYGGESASPWLNDAVEIFFDGQNEDSASYDLNDQQWRWVYGLTMGDGDSIGIGTGRRGPGEWEWLQTDVGYNFELRIHQDSLVGGRLGGQTLFEYSADQEIGFEITNADREDAVGTRQDALHWWTPVATTWNNPTLFGTALLSEKIVDEVMIVPYTDTEPSIDGEMEPGEWDIAYENTMDLFENFIGAPDTVLTHWSDHQASFWTMWDEEYFYLFASVVDDSLYGGESASPWLNDAIELFIDGGNEDSASYDLNDQQWRWVYGLTVGDADSIPISSGRRGPGEWEWLETETGYNFELRIPQDSLVGGRLGGQILFQYEPDTEFGFEVSNADRENAAGDRQDTRHWWTSNQLTWNNPTLFGTALLSGATDVVPEINILNSYSLRQNYPNPFNPSTQIRFVLPQSEKVKLTVYNLLGMKVATLVDGIRNAGENVVNFNAHGFPSGVYFYKLETQNSTMTKKMMLLK